LGGYTSAVLLVGVVIFMAWESASRLVHPASIAFDEAIAIACIGLLVNLCSAWLLAGAGGAGHGHSHDHAHKDVHGNAHSHDHSHDTDRGHGAEGATRRHRDLNLRAAYVHVAADAGTSVLAIGALTAGKFLGATWLDPVMGIVGSVIVAAWAFTLLRDTGRVLLDAEMNAPMVAAIRNAVCGGNAARTIEDLHVWRVGKGKYACVLSVESAEPVSPDEIRSLLSVHEELTHVTVEVNQRA
ncbi:MAG TPA: CDF family Co(II)/Ni(II) efflux transporter DmeF, partial [Steroidobacteraceae bacterium]